MKRNPDREKPTNQEENMAKLENEKVVDETENCRKKLLSLHFLDSRANNIPQQIFAPSPLDGWQNPPRKDE